MIAEGTKQKPNPKKTDGPANVAKFPYDLYFSLHKYELMKKLNSYFWKHEKQTFIEHL